MNNRLAYTLNEYFYNLNGFYPSDDVLIRLIATYNFYNKKIDDGLL